MKLRPPRRRPAHETVTALIDVVFFLLVFFMLIGRMDATAPFDVLPPVGHSGQDLPSGGITLSVAADGRLAEGGATLPPEALAGRVAARLRAEPELLVRVNADQDAQMRFVLPLVSQLEELGARNVVLIVTPQLP